MYLGMLQQHLRLSTLYVGIGQDVLARSISIQLKTIPSYYLDMSKEANNQIGVTTSMSLSLSFSRLDRTFWRQRIEDDEKEQGKEEG